MEAHGDSNSGFDSTAQSINEAFSILHNRVGGREDTCQRANHVDGNETLEENPLTYIGQAVLMTLGIDGTSLV